MKISHDVLSGATIIDYKWDIDDKRKRRIMGIIIEAKNGKRYAIYPTAYSRLTEMGDYMQIFRLALWEIQHEQPA